MDFQARRETSEKRRNGEITDREAIHYLDSLKGAAALANAEGLLYANNSISRERAIDLTMAWLDRRGESREVLEWMLD